MSNNEHCFYLQYPKCKKFAIKHYLVFFCYLHSPVDVSLMIPGAVSRHIWTPFSTVPPFNLGNILMEFLTCSSETAAVFSGKNSSGNAENEVSVTLHRMASYDEISSCTISLKFPAFAWPSKFLQTFYRAFQGLVSV